MYIQLLKHMYLGGNSEIDPFVLEYECVRRADIANELDYVRAKSKKH